MGNLPPLMAVGKTLKSSYTLMYNYEVKKFFGGQLFALYVLYCKYVVDHEIAELFPTYRRWGGATGMGYIFGTLPLEILKAFFQIDLSRSVFLSNLIVYVWCLFFVYSVFGIQKLFREWNLKK